MFDLCGSVCVYLAVFVCVIRRGKKVHCSNPNYANYIVTVTSVHHCTIAPEEQHRAHLSNLKFSRALISAHFKLKVLKKACESHGK